MSFFLALILSGLVFRCLRGCTKWLVIGGVLAFIANRDPVLWSKCVDLAEQGFHALREWVISR